MMTDDQKMIKECFAGLADAMEQAFEIAIRRALREEMGSLVADQSDRYVYGYRGVQELFHCGVNKAHELINSTIREAVTQSCVGGRIRVDKVKAVALYEAATKKIEK